MSDPLRIEVRVNGRTRAFEVRPHHTLLDSLRDDLGLTGTKACCLVGECGACTVLLNGRSVDACLVLAVEADGGDVVTVEGLAVDGQLSALQAAFLETGAAQCGFCIPGQLMAAHALLATTPDPDRAGIEEGLAGNYCRCAGYEQIIEAVQLAARGTTGPSDAHPAADAHSARAAHPDAADRPDVADRPDAQVAPQ
ncbi:MAG TPA: (2Fe-2S)-binding protein [Candidatus Limnocylindrales bacterium]|nr:(2Fe-2S)-binding protein [Candidatus Limnocylindrales bacterium]